MRDELKKCDKPDCKRLTGRNVPYCCYPCRLAAEGNYEIHESGPLGHSEGCDRRQAERTR